MATVAAGIVAAFAIVTFAFQATAADPVGQMLFWGVALFASGIAAFGAILPALIAIAIAETFSIRSALIYALTGAAIMLIGYYSAGFATAYSESIDVAPPAISREAEIAAAVGVVFGLTYWMIAGRRAGAWRRLA